MDSINKENLKVYIEQLIDIEKQEEKYKNISSTLKKEKELLNQNIIDFMNKNNIANKDIIFGEKKIKCSSIKIQESITKKLIFDRLKVFLKNEETAKNAVDFIYQERNSSQKYFLKISDIKK
jgi:2C-methyl-D-erythritol 2,4-cyclodiphosphate synthase